MVGTGSDDSMVRCTFFWRFEEEGREVSALRFLLCKTTFGLLALFDVCGLTKDFDIAYGLETDGGCKSRGGVKSTDGSIALRGCNKLWYQSLTVVMC